jgi:hypothetical protein
MYTPFKMKGKSPMMKALIGKQNNLPEQLKAKILASPESPAKMKKSPAKSTSKAAKNLLKAVPNKKAYEKLSDENKKGFDRAAKKAGLPTKKSPTRMMGKDPSKKKTKMLKGTTVFGKEVTKKGVRRVAEAVATGGMSEVARTDIGKKVKKYGKEVVGSMKKVIKTATNSGALQAGGPRKKKVTAKNTKAVKKRAVRKGAAEGLVGSMTQSMTKGPVEKKYTKKLGKKRIKSKTKKQTEIERYENDHINKKTGKSLFKEKKSPAKNYKKGYYGA